MAAAARLLGGTYLPAVAGLGGSGFFTSCGGGFSGSDGDAAAKKQMV